MKHKKIPRTDSIEELAKFWDTHDLTDFEGELDEVHEPVFENQAIVTVHLEAEEANMVKALAKSRGISESSLIRQWVREHIQTS